MTTESKSIGQSYVHFALLCFVEREVQVIVDVFVVITLFVVDGRRNNAILDGEDACNGFYSTTPTIGPVISPIASVTAWREV